MSGGDRVKESKTLRGRAKPRRELGNCRFCNVFNKYLNHERLHVLAGDGRLLAQSHFDLGTQGKL